MDAVELFINQYGEKLVAALEKALPRTTDASGFLRQNIRFTVKRFGINYSFQLYLPDYYIWVDKGRKAGKMPPFASIWQWINDKRLEVHPEHGLQVSRPGSKYKLLRLSQTVNTRFKKRQPPQGTLKKISDQMKLRRSLTFAIMRKIGKHGTKGTGFYSSTVPGWLTEFKRDISIALKRDVIVEIVQAIPKPTQIKFG